MISLGHGKTVRIGPIVASGGTLLGLLAVWFGVVAPLAVWHRHAQERLVEQSERLGRLKAVAAYRDATPGANADTITRSFRDKFLAGADDRLILAELQSRVRDIVLRQQVEFNSARVLPNKTLGASTYVGLRIEMRGDMKNVHEVIRAIESGQPYLFIERLSLVPDDRRSGAPTQSLATLTAELEVFGPKWTVPVRSEQSR